MQDQQVKEPLLESFTLEGVGPAPQGANVRRLKAGELCPNCQSERLDYDGLLNLACPKCGAVASGCFT